MLRCGIIGLPLAGKTTVFNVITRAGAEVKAYAGGKTDPNRAVVDVPDERFDSLVQVFQPRKQVPASVEFVDLAGLSKDASKGAGLGNAFLSFVADSDALIHVIRCFDNPEVPHPEESVNPVRDWEIVEMELVFRDLGVIENRLVRLGEKKRPSPDEKKEAELLERCKAHLLEEKPLRELDLKEEEKKALRGFSFLTFKPELVVLNCDETQTEDDSIPLYGKFLELSSERELQVVRLFGRMEMDLADLDADSQAEIMGELGIPEPGRKRLITAAFKRLGLISFFTVGKDEVKAWNLPEGSTALDAAGTIHTDLARGFIRAQVVHYNDFRQEGFSMAKCREKGVLRLEGRDYVVADGDILEIRFNI